MSSMPIWWHSMAKEHPAHNLRISNSRRRPAGRLFAFVLRKGECGEAVENGRGICYTFLISERQKPDAKPVDHGGERYADRHRKSPKGDFRDREPECCGPAAALA